MKPKTYLIRTFGCQMNIADSELVAGMLESLGYEKVASLNDLPDLYVINTCSVRQAAEDKVYGLAPKVTQLKKSNPQAIVVVMGCMVGSARGERKRIEETVLRTKIPWADYLYSHDEIQSLLEVLLHDDKKTPWAERTLPPTPKRPPGKHAFVTISNGCDNFCTFCVVPYARGKEKSRSAEVIIKEIETLTQQGYEHFTLLGQNVNSWGIKDACLPARRGKRNIRTNSDEKLPFAKLLRDIHKIEGVKKISFLSSNPFDFTNDLVQTLKLPKIDRYLHLAVQSGDDEVLRRMNRRHSVQELVSLIEEIKRAVPEIEIGTDLIVGFPGETEKQFQNTVALCKKIRFSVAFISLYSPRPGTSAEKLTEDTIPRRTKKKRHAELSKIVQRYKRERTR